MPLFRGNKKNTLHILLILLVDIAVLVFADLFGFLLRWDFVWADIPAKYLLNLRHFLPLQIAATVGLFACTRMYSFLWRSVSADDLVHMIMSEAGAWLLCFGLQYVFKCRLPRSVNLIAGLCEGVLFTLMRSMLRLMSILSKRSSFRGDRILLIGAGDAGTMLLREINGKHNSGRVVCLIDDNPVMQGRYLEGVKIAGGRNDIPRAVQQYNIQKIVLAIPSASAEQQKEILDICKDTGCLIRTLPNIASLVGSEVTVSMLREVKIEDLLGRDPVQLDAELIASSLKDKVVLVTGGGGSIGSELCRQAARRNVKQLIILDINENYVYLLAKELRQTFGDGLNLALEIASVRDKDKLEAIMFRYHPDLVLHAAAHKHVPLMEHNPEEAVKNNIFGTYHVIRACEKAQVKRFVLISTDKAVNPTNFMGATKRFCEMILTSRPKSSTTFCAVRFGNVLGSNGSVIPIFKKQIEAGGPVTLTDKRITRFFMTIPEAAQLVLEAAAGAEDRQIFVLDMGEPVKILDLAENLIRLSGLVPYKDIDITEIGLRPGEKLYEELLTKGRDLQTTPNAKIFVEQPETFSHEKIMADLKTLDSAVSENAPSETLITLLRSLVPTYRSPEEVNAEAIRKEAAHEAV